MAGPLAADVNAASDAAPPVLKPETLERAHSLMPGADVYALEAEWRAMWQRSGSPRLRQADGAFLGWVKKRARDA